MRFLAAVLLCLGVFAAACSSNTAADGQTTTPAETPGSATPQPVPGLVFGSERGPGGRLTEGTHCWDGRCVDMAGPVTATEPFVLEAGLELDLLFEGIQPSKVEHAWVPIPASPQREMVNDTFVWLNVVPGPSESGPVITPGEPGEYLLVVFARWDGGGDYSFAGYFDIR